MEGWGRPPPSGGASPKAMGGLWQDMFYVYILKSQKTGRFYIGSTSDLEKRILAHNKGSNKSTKYGRPWELIYTENCTDKKGAWLRENQIKKYKSGEAFKKLIKK